MMSNKDSNVLPDVNQLIQDKLRSYPDPVAEIATKAIQMAENLNETTVFEALQQLVREAVREAGGES